MAAEFIEDLVSFLHLKETLTHYPCKCLLYLGSLLNLLPIPSPRGDHHLDHPPPCTSYPPHTAESATKLP